MERWRFKGFKSPGGRVVHVKRVVAEGPAVLPPEQRGVTLLLSWLQVQERGTVERDLGAQVPRVRARARIWLERWRFGARGLCQHTVLLESCSQWRPSCPGSAQAAEPAGVPPPPSPSNTGWESIFTGTFNEEAVGKRGRAVALMHAGVIALVFQTDRGKVQVCFSILFWEVTAVFLPGSLGEGGGGLQGAVQPVGRLPGTRSDHVLLHSGLIHARLSCKQRQRRGHVTRPSF